MSRESVLRVALAILGAVLIAIGLLDLIVLEDPEHETTFLQSYVPSGTFQLIIGIASCVLSFRLKRRRSSKTGDVDSR